MENGVNDIEWAVGSRLYLLLLQNFYSAIWHFE